MNSGDGLTVEQAGMVFVTPAAYADEARFHAAAALLRREAPVHLVDHPNFNPFYAITRHADVLEIEAHPAEFQNAPRSILGNKESDQRRVEKGNFLTTLVHMDDPEHRLHRNLTSEWFLPKNLAKLTSRLDDLADETVHKMEAADGTCDFARDIAMPYPLQVILAILGLPESDYPRMLQLTQELFGAEDAELQRDPDALAGVAKIVGDFITYFQALSADRQSNPTGDLASVIANGQIGGEPIDFLKMISYYVIVATAGHDTTSNAMAGGLKALIDHPAELARLQADPQLMATAVDEMIRWTSPVKHFMRTAAVDYTIGGTTIHQGEDVLLSYWSANHDETVFASPFRFDAGRTPNKHLAFGFGVHFCLGALLAKMELKSLFTALLPRLTSVAINGEPALSHSTFVSGFKRLPIRYELS